MDIVVCTAADREAWENYVQHSRKATICHQFQWCTIIEQAYGHRAFYLMARHAGTVVGILPLVLVQAPLLGTSLTSMPFLDYGGPCADTDEIARQLLSYALRLGCKHKARTVELRQVEPPTQPGSLRLDKVSMILDLSAGAESVWRSLPPKVRNQVRKAEKSGLTENMGGGDLLDEFYHVFAVNMRDLGSPVHDRAFFAALFAEFGERARLLVVRDGARTVGGLVCLAFKETLLVPWASSLRQYFSKCPNNLLYWRAIEYGYALGCRQFDFGRSSIGSGTYDFKRQWGAEPRQLYWQVLTQNGGHELSVSASNPKYRAILAVWRRLPLTVTTMVGPRIRKYLTN